MRLPLLIAVVVGLVVPAQARPRKSPPKQRDAGALVIVMDRSGSMQGGKLEHAKKAALASSKVLVKDDTFALVTFDSEAKVAVPPKRATSSGQIAKEIGAIEAGGGTNVFPGLQEAAAILATVDAKKKHVLLFSDGEAPLDGVIDLAREMHAKGITISTVGVPGADRNMLSAIASEGGGRMYMVDELGTLSRVFQKETLIAMAAPAR